MSEQVSSEPAKEYSIEWFRELYEYHDEWLGEQARQLWKHYEELEQENERLRGIIDRMVDDIPSGEDYLDAIEEQEVQDE